MATTTKEIRDMIADVQVDSRGVDQLASVCYLLCDLVDQLHLDIEVIGKLLPSLGANQGEAK